MRYLYTLVVLVALAAGAGAQTPQLADVLAKSALFVAGLESSLPVLAVDEEYAQTAETAKQMGGSSLGVGGGVNNAMLEGHTVRSKRTSQSELLLVRRPDAPLLWSGVRRTLAVDGKPTGGEAGSLERLAADAATLAREWAALATASREVQIGEPERGPHVALTALALLRADQQPRVAFKKDGEETVAGVRTWKVALLEQKTPALLKATGNVPLPLRGWVWIDPASGQVLRSKIELGTGMTMHQMRVEVEYAPHPALGVPLPATMKERYDNERGSKVEAKTTFRNWRRAGPPAPGRP